MRHWQWRLESAFFSPFLFVRRKPQLPCTSMGECVMVRSNGRRHTPFISSSQTNRETCQTVLLMMTRLYCQEINTTSGNEWNHANTIRTDTVYRTINAIKRNVVYFTRVICVQKRCPRPFYPYRVSPSRFFFGENISENWSVSTENVLHAVVSPTRGDFDRHDSLRRRDVAATFFVVSAISRA